MPHVVRVQTGELTQPTGAIGAVLIIPNYQVKPKWTLQGGWGYLTVHYGNNGNLFNGTIQGIVLGATYKFK